MRYRRRVLASLRVDGQVGGKLEKDLETERLKKACTDNLQHKLKDLDAAWRRYFYTVGDA